MKQGFCDLLNYLLLQDKETILHKNGALSRHFIYQPPDIDALAQDIILELSNTWQESFNFLGDGWVLETNIVSFDSHNFINTQYVLSITFLRNNAASIFNQKVCEFIGFLKRALVDIKVLAGDKLVSFLHSCISGKNCVLQAPFQGALLDTYLAYDFVTGFEPKINEEYVVAISIDDLPHTSYPTILESLSYLAIDYRFSSRFMLLGKDSAQAYIKRHTKNWSSKAIGALGIIRESLGLEVELNQDAQATADELKMLQTLNESGKLSFCFYNAVLILHGSNLAKLQKDAFEIINHIQQLNFKARLETINACSAYLGSLPGHTQYNLRKMLIDSRFASHVIPISSIYMGQQNYLLKTITKGARPFYLSLHVGDVGHTAILGPTGSGKTTLLAHLIKAHSKIENSRIIVLDKDYSNQATIQALHGKYLDLAKKEHQLSPLANITPNDDYAITQAVTWLETILGAQGLTLDTDQQKLLFEAVVRLSSEPQQYKNLEHLTLQNKELRCALDNINQGIFKYLLNGTANTLDSNNIIGFEVGNFLNDAQQKTIIPLVSAIFQELTLLFQSKRPTLLILEEAWCYLQDPLFQAKLHDWFKTLRKFNVAIILVSQDIADLAASKSFSTISSACLTRIFLPNNQAADKLLQEHYLAFGLQQEEIDIIYNATPKQDYYYKSPYGARLFQLNMEEL